jgi:DNA (cytosine-5)-methyltransferase 1
MIYGSVCSGIEAATVAWHTLGWKPAFFSEIETFPRAVLKHHYPSVPLHGDFTTISEDDYGAIDLLVGGTPCQAFSVAGLRKGFADERGNLTLEFIRLAQRKKPRWLVWENVPGVLSQDDGRVFGAFLGGLAECGYGFAYRVLDAQYFGVPQRRKRVFVIGYLGDWRPPAAVLFERESLQGDITPDRQERKVGSPAPTLTKCGYGSRRSGEIQILCEDSSIRMSTPREVERCFGFPDDYTLICRASDAARAGALGNSMAVPVMKWIGERIAMVDAML